MDLFSVVETLEILESAKYFFIEAPAWRLQSDMKADHPIETDDSNRNILATVERWWQWIQTSAITTDDEFTPSPRLGGNHILQKHKRNCDTFIDSFG